MKCFYHNDADGKCAAFWVHNTQKARDEHEPYFQVVDYGRPFPHDMVKPGEQVWIVDFSLETADMEELIQKCGIENIYWIDHHKTAIDKYEGFPHDLQGVRDIEKAACELTFQFTQWWSRPEDDERTFEEFCITLETPLFTQLIADRDIWKWEFGKSTKHFYAGSQLLDTRPFSKDWERLLNEPNFCEQIKENGKLVEQFRARQRRIDISYFGYEVEFEGHQCMAINGPASGDLGQNVRSQGYEIAIIYRRDKAGQWTVSLYSDSVDVGEIARAFGGGGHKGAAGFKTDEDPNSLWL